jgi:MFS transporter, ACS family, tartrate transporter
LPISFPISTASDLAFAALTMNAELKFSPIIFAWGAGIFFVCYFIFEVPSNLALERFGASRWIARIMDGAMGLKGWQWLFITEGIPSILLGIVTWFYLTDRPERADWLSPEQKAWLAAKLNAEIAAKQAAKRLKLGEALSSPKVITLSLAYFGFVGALYGMQFWLPQIVKAFGFTNAQTGFVTAIPYLFGTIAMILWARHSDASRERVLHVGAPLLLTALALGVSSYVSDPAMTMVVLTVAAIGVFCTFGVF